VQARGSRGPEAAARVEAVIRPATPGLVLEAVFAVVVGDDEQDVVLICVAVVLEVGDIGGDLLAHPLQRLCGPIPLEVEEDPPSVGAVDPAPVRRGYPLLDLARALPVLLADLLLTAPDLESLAAYPSAAAHQGDEELVGLEVVDGVPAVIPRLMAALDVGALVVAMPVGEHPSPPRRDQAHGMTTTDARCLDDFPNVDETQRVELVESDLTGTKAGEEELLELERVEVAIVVEGLQDYQVALGE